MDSRHFACALTLTVFTCVTIALASLVNSIVIRPYMDEIFHIPQVQEYCKSNFKYWDTKITTPPGLYLASIGLLKPFTFFLPSIFKCDIVNLRNINLIFAFGNFYIFSAIIKKLNDTKKESGGPWHSAMTSLTLCTFPPLYFFTFLYYTDVGSTFTVLLSYLLALHKSHFLASLIGAVAVLFRQTNIIWMIFFGMLALKDVVQKHAPVKELTKLNTFSWTYVKVVLLLTTELVTKQRKQINWPLLWDFVTNCCGYICVGIGFLLFLIWNQGIVLGDRSAHSATIHLPQIFYFCAFTLFFAFPHLVCNGLLCKLTNFARKNLGTVLMIGFILGICIAVNTLTHPYLLADNRHYPFYIWRKILGRNSWTKFLPIPIYVYAGMAILDILRYNRGLLWLMAYTMCVTACLIPQELLEFRYFILPYLIFRLNVPITKNATIIFIEFSTYCFVNFISLYLFLLKPFVWPNEDVLQRFMW